MEFVKYLSSLKITDNVLFVKEKEKLKTWTIDGAGVLSCLGEYRGEEASLLPDVFSMDASKLQEIVNFAKKDMSFEFDHGTLIVEGKDKKISYQLQKSKRTDIPTMKLDYGKPLFRIESSSMQEILKARTIVKSLSVTINADKDSVDFIIRGVVPGNKILLKFDKLRDDIEETQSFPNNLFEVLSMCNGDAFDVYMGVSEKPAPLRMTFADETSKLDYYVAQRIEDKTEDAKEEPKEE